jgi:hypothetical protein
LGDIKRIKKVSDEDEKDEALKAVKTRRIQKDWFKAVKWGDI